MTTHPINSITYRAAVAEALMRDHRRNWRDAFETAEAISATYMVEGISPQVAALLWVRYITHPVAAAPSEPSSHDTRAAA